MIFRLIITIGIAGLASCTASTGGLDAGPAMPTPAYEMLAEAHNARVTGLDQVYARGNIELRWTDDAGKQHFEPGDLDLWIDRPDRTALSITKFGERYMWIGSAGDRSWVFDLTGDEKVLHCADARTGWAVGPAGGRLLVGPGTLLTLVGLATLPPATDEPPGVSWDPGHKTWVVTIDERGGTHRFFLDPATGHPVRTELMGPDGSLHIWSEIKLSRYEPITVAGGVRSIAKFPTLVDIYTADGLNHVKLVAPSPTNDVKPKYFDVDWLIRALGPTRIEGDCE